MKNPRGEIKPSVGDFIVANLSPDLGAVGADFSEPGVAELVRSQKIGWPICDVDQGLSVHGVILTEVAFRLPEYVAAPGFINCNRCHSGRN
jgi:hypothetical protein